VQGKAMEELSGLDASFLYLEAPNMPMHIGAVAIIEGSLKFEDFRQFVQSRLHTVPKLRQKLVSVPLDLDRPYWIDDPNFDLKQHVHRMVLPKPAGWEELRAIASQSFSRPLERDRPLWEFIFVEGLDALAQVPKGSVALISKVHHAAFDGKSGMDLMAMLYEASPIPKDLAPYIPKKAETMPSAVSLLAKSASHLITLPVKLPGLLWDSTKASLKAGFLKRSKGMSMPTLPFQAPKTRFNDTVDAQRIWNSALLDMSHVKTLRKAVPGATLNDVILAICAGGFRRYLLEKKELPTKPLVAMVPISTRTKEEKNAMGNQVSAMYVQLATDLEDPIARLQKIHRNTVEGKRYQDAVDAKSLVEYAELIPFGLASVAAQLYTRTALAKHHSPLFNVVITNVPGPQIPVYMAGHKLIVNMGTAPIFDGVGIIITICSYNNIISISPTSSLNLMPDLDDFTQYLRESAKELEAAVHKNTQASAVLTNFIGQ